MKSYKSLVLLLLIPLFSFVVAHKFYVSVTNIEYSKLDNSLQITTRIFIDDFQKVMEMRYDLKEELTTEKKVKEVEQMMEKYLKKKLKIWVNGEQKAFTFIGKKYEDDVTICYLEIPNIKDVTSIEVENDILYELEEDQQNLVHVKIKDQRKSLLLVKENDKGLLNF
ncbi:DUF6702 family protein [uncultured Kordia sp.]|uniref:DUF6702 family protein n=1 Tax=uncultured Kordia sp. TaxID=507699 RepID=UPI002625A4BA|nr:DUF6702 family protein [uncultured Kordia sp.]